jgi:hypothetical protein
MNSHIEITDTAAAKDDHVHTSTISESTTVGAQGMSLTSGDYSDSDGSKLESSAGSKQDVVVNEETQVRKLVHYQGTMGLQVSSEVTSGHPLRSVRWTE